ncbi:MAG: hypothetical protein L3J35_07765 [Bacteroidales bacterium]|nr:hypothetical protein [Bacteroidales bacterium]
MQTYHTNITEYCFLPGGAIYKTTNGTDELLFTYTDHIGSITHITDNEGNLLAEQSFDAWGRARNPETWKYPSEGVALSHTLTIVNGRGYTGYEHLTNFGLINMNGPRRHSFVTSATTAYVFNYVVKRMLYVNTEKKLSTFTFKLST